MVVVDTSSMIAYLEGSAGRDVEAVQAALEAEQVALAPVVLTELLSDPKLPKAIAKHFCTLPLLPMGEGYWERAARLRALVLRRRHKARLADALIAQTCIDHRVPLITRDRDFRHYISAGLRLTSS